MTAARAVRRTSNRSGAVAAPDAVLVDGVELRRGSRVRLAPRAGVAIQDRLEAAVALAVFAAATAMSMATLSLLFGYAITREPVLRRLTALTPLLGVLSLTFGAVYTLGAIGA